MKLMEILRKTLVLGSLSFAVCIGYDLRDRTPSDDFMFPVAIAILLLLNAFVLFKLQSNSLLFDFFHLKLERKIAEEKKKLEEIQR